MDSDKKQVPEVANKFGVTVDELVQGRFPFSDQYASKPAPNVVRLIGEPGELIPVVHNLNQGTLDFPDRLATARQPSVVIVTEQDAIRNLYKAGSSLVTADGWNYKDLTQYNLKDKEPDPRGPGITKAVLGFVKN